jgi:prepilin-type processing-associated H-X9-DG protein
MKQQFIVPRASFNRRGFTMTELLVIILALAVLGSLFLAMATGGDSKTKRAQCAANLRQFNQAMHIYGNENNGKLPPGNVGYWPWDIAWSVGSFVESTGSKWTVMYCPGTSPYFTQTDNWQLYNFVPGNFRVIGYAHTLPGSGTVVATNINNMLLPEPIQVGFGVFVRPRPAERVLFADATISGFGQIVTALKYHSSYSYTSIQGGLAKPHLTAHLKGRFPAGGNVTMLDGHVEWRKFDQMVSRVAGGSVPGFWW